MLLAAVLLAAVKDSVEFEGGEEEAYRGVRGEDSRFTSGSGLMRESVLGVLEPLVLESSLEGGERRGAVCKPLTWNVREDSPCDIDLFGLLLTLLLRSVAFHLHELLR